MYVDSQDPPPDRAGVAPRATEGPVAPGPPNASTAVLQSAWLPGTMIRARRGSALRRPARSGSIQDKDCGVWPGGARRWMGAEVAMGQNWGTLVDHRK